MANGRKSLRTGAFGPNELGGSETSWLMRLTWNHNFHVDHSCINLHSSLAKRIFEFN